MKIYTVVTAPFALGGTHHLIATDTEPTRRARIIGRSLAVFQNPKTGKFHVADVECGALVGFGNTAAEALDVVRRDLAAGDPAVVEQQVAQGKKDRDSAHVVEPEVFWRKFR